MRECIPQIVAQNIFLGINLNASALVAHVNEHGFAHFTMRGDASGDGDFTAFGVIFSRIGAGFGRRKFIFERENAFGFKLLELGFALFDE